MAGLDETLEGIKNEPDKFIELFGDEIKNLTQFQLILFNAIMSGEKVFVRWPMGSGKSYMRRLLEDIDKRFGNELRQLSGEKATDGDSTDKN